MKHAILGLVVLAPALALADDHEDVKRFTAAKVFEIEVANDPQIAPDGESIVYVRRSMDIEKDRLASALWVYDLDEDRHYPLLDGDSAGSAPRWSPDGERIAFLSSREGKPDLKVHDLETGRTFSLAKLQEGTSPPVWSPDGDRVAFSMFVPEKPEPLISLPPKPEGAEWAEPIRVYDKLRFRGDGQGYLEPGEYQVFVLPTDGGTPRQVSSLEGGTSSPVWLDEKTLIVSGNEDEKRDLQPQENRLYRISLEDGSAEALTEEGSAAFSPTLGPRGSRVAYLMQPNGEEVHQQTDLVIWDVDSGESRNLTEEYDRSPVQIAWHPNGNAVLGLVEDEGLLRLVEFGVNGNVRTLTDEVGSAGTGRPYGGGSFSVSDNARVAFTQRNGVLPAELAVLTRRGTRTLTSLNDDALGDVTLARVEKMKVPSSVGDYDIDAWVAFPPGYEKDGSYPMILEIHGGPYAMYGPHFSAEVQRYAAEGYVTVWTNPRGSTGYGEEFAQEIDLAYPGEDYDDLMSVTDHLVDEGYVSEDRLFVTGGSGGGVLTAWIVGNTDKFAAAASIKPVINWTSESLTADLAAFAVMDWLRDYPWENQELYWELSPLSKVGNVTTPTMLMVGTEDWRTPMWEAEQFYTALKLRGVDTLLVHVPGASHYIAARPSHLIAKTEAIMAWFERYDPEAAEDEE
ncbi:alpha/beta hydrolase family protein [Parvularcula lutaonensis]|uniref:Prolyl oligopeptidase family serine peptidase n=1 Tax=Parvularcula lutaonensis TaxID=491923 RepID=A0ABV7MBZ9_9PROT|nr:S9 family peptidase [Parvularcula lutaonensis]GGY37269.1 acyl-peptide hydrolase [Parvularcula lutaonensis]